MSIPATQVKQTACHYDNLAAIDPASTSAGNACIATGQIKNRIVPLNNARKNTVPVNTTIPTTISTIFSMYPPTAKRLCLMVVVNHRSLTDGGVTIRFGVQRYDPIAPAICTALTLALHQAPSLSRCPMVPLTCNGFSKYLASITAASLSPAQGGKRRRQYLTVGYLTHSDIHCRVVLYDPQRQCIDPLRKL